jgi:CRP-like cAMP-binding protein
MSLLQRKAIANRLLAALSPEEYRRLTEGSERIRLPKGRILIEAGSKVQHAFFPLSGTASLLSMTESGKVVEVAAVGSEGMIGLPAVLGEGISPYQVAVQLHCEAVKVRAGRLRAEFDGGGRLHELLLRHALGLLTQVTQAAACHRFHTVGQRLAHWLLSTRDRADSDTFQLTQEYLSHMLGVPRTSVTALAVAMRNAGLIHYGRGKITVIDGLKLEASSCECYRINARQAAELRELHAARSAA